MEIKQSIKLTLVIIFIGLFFPRPAYAYLDPGTGSYIIQLIIGAFLGGGYLIKVYWKEIKAKFQQLTKRKLHQDDQPSV